MNVPVPAGAGDAAFAGGRLVSVLAGGYDHAGTAEGAPAHVRVLAGIGEPSN